MQNNGKLSKQKEIVRCTYNEKPDLILDEARIADVHDERIFLLECIVHFADISNPGKPLQIAKKWAECVMTEFFKQGDKERSLGLPVSPMMDRYTSVIEKVQFGFLNFVVVPYAKKLALLFQRAGVCLNQLEMNAKHWNEIIESKKNQTDEKNQN